MFIVLLAGYLIQMHPTCVWSTIFTTLTENDNLFLYRQWSKCVNKALFWMHFWCNNVMQYSKGSLKTQMNNIATTFQNLSKWLQGVSGIHNKDSFLMLLFFWWIFWLSFFKMKMCVWIIIKIIFFFSDNLGTVWRYFAHLKCII